MPEAEFVAGRHCNERSDRADCEVVFHLYALITLSARYGLNADSRQCDFSIVRVMCVKSGCVHGIYCRPTGTILDTAFDWTAFEPSSVPLAATARYTAERGLLRSVSGNFSSRHTTYSYAAIHLS